MFRGKIDLLQKNPDIYQGRDVFLMRINVLLTTFTSLLLSTGGYSEFTRIALLDIH